MFFSKKASKPDPAPAAPPAPPSDRPREKRAIWEDLIALNSGVDKEFELLAPAASHLETDTRVHTWADMDYAEALARDTFPLPATADREGYYGPDHFSYWASGLRDARLLVEAADRHGVGLKSCLDLGCASGRVIRHVALEHAGARVLGCDINRLHVEWCNRHLPANCTVFQNHSIPSLPLADGSVDVVSAYSVFTHIEALETAWLMELRRVLRPGGIAWITWHSEFTLADMTPDWPLWKPTMSHPEAAKRLDAERRFVGDRLVLRWHTDRSYSSNVFYKTDYVTSHWSRIFEIVEIRRRCPVFQDVLILRKSE